MSLAALIKAEQTDKTATCKTCDVLARLTDGDRRDFAEAAADGVQASVLARALTACLAEADIDMAVGQGSVRTHIRRGHSA